MSLLVVGYSHERQQRSLTTRVGRDEATKAVLMIQPLWPVVSMATSLDTKGYRQNIILEGISVRDILCCYANAFRLYHCHAGISNNSLAASSLS